MQLIYRALTEYAIVAALFLGLAYGFGFFVKPDQPSIFEEKKSFDSEDYFTIFGLAFLAYLLVYIARFVASLISKNLLFQKLLEIILVWLGMGGFLKFVTEDVNNPTQKLTFKEMFTLPFLTISAIPYAFTYIAIILVSYFWPFDV